MGWPRVSPGFESGFPPVGGKIFSTTNVVEKSGDRVLRRKDLRRQLGKLGQVPQVPGEFGDDGRTPPTTPGTTKSSPSTPRGFTEMSRGCAKRHPRNSAPEREGTPSGGRESFAGTGVVGLVGARWRTVCRAVGEPGPPHHNPGLPPEGKMPHQAVHRRKSQANRPASADW